MAFSLSTVTQTGSAVLRVTFTGAMPLSASPLGRHDARNPTNWRLQGAHDIDVAEVRTVSSDPFSFDLVCGAIVEAGVWILKALNIQTVKAENLSIAQVGFVAVGAQPFFSVPSHQITSESSLRQALNAALDGPGWAAFVAALGYSDEKVARTGKAAFYQRLEATAGGEYLEKLTTASGVDRPPNVRMSDDTLRNLSIGLNNNKVNATGLEAVLLAYYGLDATVAHVQAGQAEPYALTDGATLSFNVDNQDVLVIFRDNDFSLISEARAIEAATVINRQLTLLGMRAFAAAVTDPETGLRYLRIYSGLNGIKGRMKFYGGASDSAFRFPDIANTTQTVGTIWQLQPSAVGNGIPVGRVRLSWTGGTNPTLDAVFPGDYVNIYGSPFSATNRGTYRIVTTTSSYIEYEGADFAAAQGSVTQVADDDVFFARPRVIGLNGQYVAAVVQPDLDTSEILLPVTASAVERDPLSAWYLNGRSSIQLDNSYTESGRFDGNTTVRIKTLEPHGLTPGRFFFLDEVRLDYTEDLGPAFDAVETISVSSILGAVQLRDGRIMLVDNDGDYFFFNPETQASASGGTHPLNSDLAICLLADGRVLGVDGSNWSIYDSGTNLWTSPAALPETTPYVPLFSLVLLQSNKVLNVYTETASNEVHSSVFSPATGTWSTPVLVDADAFSFFAAVLVETTGDVVMASGDGTKAHYYRALNDEWENVDDMPIQLGYTRGVFVPRGPTGEVWFVGDQTSSPQKILVFNADTISWSTRTLLQSPDQGSARTLVVRDGQVFFIPAHHSFSWELHDSHGGAARLVTGTTGPAPSDSTTNFPWAFALPDGRILAFAGQGGSYCTYYLYAEQRQRSGGQLAGGSFKVTATPAGDILEFQTAENSVHTRIAGAKLTPSLAELGTVSSGFMLNTQDGFALADGLTALTAEISRGTVPAVIAVTNTASFPDAPGYLIFDYGGSHQSQAVRYLGIASSTQIRLDPNGELPFAYGVGATISLLQGRGVFAPEDSIPLGVTWLTDSSVGRVEAEKDLAFATGVGMNIINRVLYPGDRGLGNETLPHSGVQKISDAVAIWGSDSYLDEAAAAREET